MKYTHIETQVGGTGVLVTLIQEKQGNHYCLGAELDGLPIQEVNDIAHKSVYEGKGHQCGHDGHLTMLAGVGAWISETLKVESTFDFQPAEENGEGAKAVMNDERFKV